MFAIHVEKSHPVPVCLFHSCSSLSWDVNHRMRPAAGKRPKRIADECGTRIFWPLFCFNLQAHTFHATPRGREIHWNTLAIFFNCIYSHCRGLQRMCPNNRCLFERRIIYFEFPGGTAAVERCQMISNQSAKLNLESSSIPSHLLRCDGAGWKQTISGNQNLFKVTERVRETDWHWWDQTRTVLHCARASQAWLIECDETVTEQGEQERDRPDGGREWSGLTRLER